jgi:SPP1 family phage portal protein
MEEAAIENVEVRTEVNGFAGWLCGRRDIYTAVDRITADNVVYEVNSALTYHLANVIEMEYLYWYRRGLQPILNRTKERNEFVLNKVVENHADEIVTFKNGYFLMEPASYIARGDNVSASKVNKVNEYLYRSGKQDADNQLADWFHTVGKAALFVEPNRDKDSDEVPVRAYALDPRSAFVVYSLKPGNKPMFGVNIVIDGTVAKIDVFTEDSVYRLVGGAAAVTPTTSYPTYQTTASAIDRIERNTLGKIPIIEYRYNSVNMSAFEPVVSLLDQINNIQSNRCDGVEQFIQSLAVAVNCQFDDGTTAADIRKAGMVALKSIGENKADFKILSEELDQQQTQTLVDDLYEKVLVICSMPSTARGGRGTYDSTGAAAIFNNGWEQAFSAARNTEDLFKVSNRRFDEIFLSILKQKGIVDISPVDIKLNFVRNETAGAQSKAQAMQTMLAAGMAPELALAKSGISSDPVADYSASKKFMRMIWGDPDEVIKKQQSEQTEQSEQAPSGQGEAQIVEDDHITEEQI